MAFVNEYIQDLVSNHNYDEKILTDTWNNMIHPQENIWFIKSPDESFGDPVGNDGEPFLDIHKTWLVKIVAGKKHKILRDNIWGMNSSVKKIHKLLIGGDKKICNGDVVLTIADFILKEHVKRAVNKLEQGRFHITTHDISTDPEKLRHQLNELPFVTEKAPFKRYMVEICQHLGYTKVGITLDALDLLASIYQFEVLNIFKHVDIISLIPNPVYSKLFSDTYENVYPFTLKDIQDNSVV